ncbi:MAG: hypothetical protein KKD86_19050 [Bacteroidetes bacterium]|nr:hypothetical protein [Bacteroidota bacterium]MBU1680922.1 hypothetical protein [Bacteroidota bacterium]
MTKKLKKSILLILIIIIGSVTGVLIGWSSPDPVSRNILIKARQYAYDPPVIKVNKGDTLHIKLTSLDVVHGFFVEGYDIDARIFSHQKKFNMRHPSEGEKWTEVEELVLITDKTGKFRYRCSNTCGTMHPFMQGELIVQPNTTYHAGVGGIVGLFLGMIWMFTRRIKRQDPSVQISRIDSN